MRVFTGTDAQMFGVFLAGKLVAISLQFLGGEYTKCCNGEAWLGFSPISERGQGFSKVLCGLRQMRVSLELISAKASGGYDCGIF